MQTKRFVAADMSRALTLVREELGEDAMILSTQRTGKGVEIIATADEIPPSPVTTGGSETSLNKVSPTPPDFTGQAQPQSQPHRESQRGPASGKTQEELARELAQARQRMLAMQQEEKLTLPQWAERQTSTSQPPHRWESNPPQQPAAVAKPSHTMHGKQDTANYAGAQASKNNEEIRRLQDEIVTMRSLFENQLAAMAEAQERHFQDQRATAEVIPLMVDIKQRLGQLGLTRACSDQVIRALKAVDTDTFNNQRLWKEALTHILRNIPVLTRDPVATGGIYAFLGTTGVGKTTTVAKFAARYVMEHGADQVALLTTDTFRIAAHDQLRSLGKILNVPVKVVDDLNHLPQHLAAFSKQALVLIDTPGMSYNDPLLKAHLTALRRCRHVQSALVLSANSQCQMMQASLHSYRIANPRFSVMTKIDECASLGDALSLLMANDLPLAYTTNGQAVPDDLEVVKPPQLINRAVKLSRLSARGQQQASSPV